MLIKKLENKHYPNKPKGMFLETFNIAQSCDLASPLIVFQFIDLWKSIKHVISSNLKDEFNNEKETISEYLRDISR